MLWCRVSVSNSNIKKRVLTISPYTPSPNAGPSIITRYSINNFSFSRLKRRFSFYVCVWVGHLLVLYIRYICSRWKWLVKFFVFFLFKVFVKFIFKLLKFVKMLIVPCYRYFRFYLCILRYVLHLCIASYNSFTFSLKCVMQILIFLIIVFSSNLNFSWSIWLVARAILKVH